MWIVNFFSAIYWVTPLKKKKIYLFEREKERAFVGGTEEEGDWEQESQADSTLSVKPDARLDLMTLRSQPKAKSRVGHYQLSPLGAPRVTPS